jgi:DNA-binding NarL/FixJ family response regulator
MCTGVVEDLLIEDFQDLRNVEQQIVKALTGITGSVSARRLRNVLVQLRETTERHVARLDRILREMEPTQDREKILHPAVAERLRVGLEGRSFCCRDPLSLNCARLTARQVEILRLIAEGHPNKQIADDLEISIKTVEKHRQHLMAKLDLHDTASVTRYAISAGVVEVDA